MLANHATRARRPTREFSSHRVTAPSRHGYFFKNSRSKRNSAFSPRRRSSSARSSASSTAPVSPAVATSRVKPTQRPLVSPPKRRTPSRIQRTGSNQRKSAHEPRGAPRVSASRYHASLGGLRKAL